MSSDCGLQIKYLSDDISYREIKDAAQEYNSASRTFKGIPAFDNWLSKPLNLEAFSAVNNEVCTIIIYLVLKNICLLSSF